MITRKDIEQEYRTENGHIVSPGKFEGQMVYVPYYWDLGLNGFADSDDGETYTFDVTDDDRAMFPELHGVVTVHVAEDSVGFVSAWTV